MTRIADLIEAYPLALTFDLDPEPDGTPRRPREELAAAIGHGARQLRPRVPDHLRAAASRCRAEAAGGTGALGKSVREDLGGIEYNAAGARRSPAASSRRRSRRRSPSSCCARPSSASSSSVR